MLAKARSDFVARRAALSAPAKFLPRLLLCSGLPKSSLLTMIDRLGQLGENSDKEDSRVFRDLLLPSSTSDWGFGHLGTRRDIARKLIGRLSSYISLNGESIESLSSNVSLTFLNWLSEECKPPENPKKIKLKKARRSTESFKLSEATSILSLKSGDEDEEDTDSSDDIESIERIGFKMGSQREKVSIEHVNNENIESFVKTCHGRSEINTMELLMERRFFVPGSVTEKRRKKRKRPNTTSEKGSIDRLELSSAIMITQDSNLEWKRARSVWIPAITKSEGSPIFWTQLFSQEMENGDVDSLLPQCILGWSTKHITSCKVWIFSLKDEQLTELCMPKVVEFLLVSCGQAATQTRNFRNNAVTMGGWMSNKASVDDIARIVFAAAKSSDVQVDNRNHLPCWIQLILLVSQAGKHQANHLVITLLTLLDKDKANEDLRMRVAVAVLRVYASFPYFVNLGNAKLRSVLLTASNSADWIPWRTPIDAPIGNILEALKSNHSQRLVQGLVDYAKSHPLILLRRLDLMAAVLKEDAGNTQPLRSAGRVRVYGESFSGAATALINGSKMKVIIRHWGYSYSDPLWVSLIEVLLSVPREVLFTCGLGMGLENFLGVYAKMLYIQSQLQNRDKTARLKSRFSDLLKIFEKHEGWNGWLSSKLDGLESLGSMRNVLVSVSLISTDQAMANIRSNKVQT